MRGLENLENKVLPNSNSAARMLPRALGIKPEEREDELERCGMSMLARGLVQDLLTGFHENHEDAELFRQLEEQYRDCLCALVDYHVISPENPSIDGVDGKSYLVPSWANIYSFFDPYILMRIKKLKEPRLLVVPFGMSLNSLLQRASGQHGFSYQTAMRYEKSEQTATDDDLDNLVELKSGKSKQDRLADKRYSFRGWRAVVIDGAETVPEDTLGQSSEDLARNFSEQCFSFPEPEDVLVFQLLGFRRGQAYDQNRVTWLNARAQGKDGKMVAYAGRNKKGTAMEIGMSDHSANPHAGGRRVLEILHDCPQTIFEHIHMSKESVETAILMEEIAPRNEAERFLLEQAVQDRKEIKEILRALRQARIPGASAFEQPVPEPLPRPAEPAAPQAPDIQPSPPAAVPAFPHAAKAPLRKLEEYSPARTLNLLLDHLVLLITIEGLTRDAWNARSQEIIRAFFEGPGEKQYKKEEIKIKLESGNNPGKLTLIATRLGMTPDDVLNMILDAVPKKPGFFSRLFRSK